MCHEMMRDEGTGVNALLEKALAELGRLPEAAQETIARIILEEIEAERAWDERLARSQDQLGELARSARAEVERGEVLRYDPSKRK
jgi:hypothetical protein